MSDALRLITEPTVTVVTRPAFDHAAMRNHLAASGLEWPDLSEPVTDNLVGHGQRAVEAGGRCCYRSWRGGRTAPEHVRHLVEVKHWSVLEHAVYGLHVAGISRACSHEVVRHRMLSPSMESQRYVDAGDVAFVVPPALLAGYAADPLPVKTPEEELDAAAFRLWRAHCHDSRSRYDRLSQRLLTRSAVAGGGRTARTKQAREAARSVLPNACETRLMLTGNLRAWVEACLKRCSADADAETRRLFNRVFDLLAKEAPEVFVGFRREPLADGSFAVRAGGAA